MTSPEVEIQVAVPSFGSGLQPLPRSAVASKRARTARSALANCRLCAHLCRVDRLNGELGLCRAGADTRVFAVQVESGDELELIPTFAIALSGCDLRCDFCITGAESWNTRAGEILDVQNLAARAEAALADGAQSVMILGGEPTIHLPTALEIVSAVPETAKLVWKTNAHGSAQARELLDGMFDVWVADFKFGNDACALRLAKVSDYLQVVRQNLIWADAHSELIVRHLLMPGHIGCCWCPIAEWLAANLPGVKTSLRDSFWPAWHSARHLELRRTISADESRRAWEIARQCGLNLVE
jgi:putative pyruvate formate lyase activating enzyme